MTELSKRMRAVADFVPPGYIAADVGCDHGFVSIFLAERGICPGVFAADVRTGPLMRAKEHIERAGLTDYITPVLSDGLKEVPVGGGTGAQVMIAAGMGGKLAVRILSDAPEKTERLLCAVLQPQSEIALVRRWLSENRFAVTAEEMVYEEGKYYPVLLARNCRCPENAAEISRAQERERLLEKRLEGAGLSGAERQEAGEWLGRQLMSQKSPVLPAFLRHTIEKDGELLRNMPPCSREGEGDGRIAKRREELSRRIRLAERVLEMMET